MWRGQIILLRLISSVKRLLVLSWRSVDKPIFLSERRWRNRFVNKLHKTSSFCTIFGAGGGGGQLPLTWWRMRCCDWLSEWVEGCDWLSECVRQASRPSSSACTPLYSLFVAQLLKVFCVVGLRVVEHHHGLHTRYGTATNTHTVRSMHVQRLICVCLFFPELKLGQKLNEGKTKQIFEIVDQPGLVLVQSKDQITAGNAARKDQMEGKAAIANKTTSCMFKLLQESGELLYN